MKNWKTTLGGLLATAGMMAQAQANETVKTVGVIVGSIGTLLLGWGAKDFDVSHTQK